MVWVLLADGFEEAEVVVPVDLLRRGDVEVKLVGVNGISVTSSHNIVMKADLPIEDVQLQSSDMVFVPGGLDGVDSILASETACALLRRGKELGCRLAAICAGPTVLSRLGLIDGKRCVCYPGMEYLLPPAVFCPDEATVVDGDLITARAAGAAYDLGLAMLTALKDAQTARQVAQSVCYFG